MDAPPPLPSRTSRFQGWLRLGLGLAALGTILSATQNEDLLECSLSPLFVIGQKHIPTAHVNEGFLDIVSGVSKIVGIVGPLLIALLSILVGGLTALYIALRWRSTPWAIWLTSYAFFWVGLCMVIGLTLRWLFGEAVAIDKKRVLEAYLVLWPAAFLTLSGCYARLLRTGTSPLPDLPPLPSQVSGNER